MQMVVEPQVVQTAVDVSSNMLLATKNTDFGGYLGPVLGLGSIFGLIAFLAPPVAPEDDIVE
eukprot:CAMPEP_0113937502 /NCGR_PEP_ID=MMETSP1339-20121228/4111_1 /TAXON_ID=94617 /ORGANISM="Fibrocapsa japonica" /LENGTH=61 /DNA_ID=CAMNT_0000940295 /DNA_START=260 /DNA_END=445 /DNA_ORIENTATION=- /assembly_acc=CAM_ASM_000762